MLLFYKFKNLAFGKACEKFPCKLLFLNSTLLTRSKEFDLKSLRGVSTIDKVKSFGEILFVYVYILVEAKLL